MASTPPRSVPVAAQAKAPAPPTPPEGAAGDAEAFDTAALLRVLEVTRELAKPGNLQQLLEAVIDAGRQVLEADRGSVFLYDPASAELYVKIATGLRTLRFSVSKGIAGECARTRQIINVPDCYADERFNPEVDRRTGYKTRCLIAVPLIGFDDELVGVLQLLNARQGRFDADDGKLAEVLASQAAVAIQKALLLEDRFVMLKLERDLEVARDIQAAVLPDPAALPRCPGYAFAAFSRPAEETGGDIYDLVRLGAGHLGPVHGASASLVWNPISERPQDDEPSAVPHFILLADATGHGIGPALSVTQVRAMIRLALRMQFDLDALLHHVNLQLTEDLAPGRFVTAFMGMLDPQQHRLHYHAAGQGPILHCRADGKIDWYDATTVPLGILSDPPSSALQTLELAPGDLVALLTDGIYEQAGPGDEVFGRERVAQAMRKHRDKPTNELLNALIDAWQSHTQDTPQQDDLTAIIVRRTG